MPLPLQPAENFDKTIGKIPRRRQCFLVRIPAGTDLNQHGAGAKMLIKPRTLQQNLPHQPRILLSCDLLNIQSERKIFSPILMPVGIVSRPHQKHDLCRSGSVDINHRTVFGSVG